MATVRREFRVSRRVDEVWDAVRDVGNVHNRLVPGVVVDTTYDGETRVCTFANGLVVAERIVTIDDDARRLVYASVGGRASHHNASLEVTATDDGAQVVWVTDLLPDDLAPLIAQLMDAGVTAMTAALSA